MELFGYIKRSKVLNIIETERRKVVEDMEFLNDIRARKNKISLETSKDRNNNLYKSSSLQGKYDTLVKLFELIVRDGM